LPDLKKQAVGRENKHSQISVLPCVGRVTQADFKLPVDAQVFLAPQTRNEGWTARSAKVTDFGDNNFRARRECPAIQQRPDDRAFRQRYGLSVPGR